MNRIEKKFKKLKNTRKKAFIAFITAGYPNLSVTEKLILEFDKIGVDIVELGVPFSDPLADGPMIQEASQQALKKKTHLVDILKLVKKIRRNVFIPICLMTYYNPIFAFGEERFVKQAKDCGVDGVIIPDLPPDEGESLLKLAKSQGVDIICFIAPTTQKKRIEYVDQVSRGFIYYVSLTGVTGARLALPQGLIKNIKLVKGLVKTPVCVGFGVSTAKQVKEIQKSADGVIVGSAIVKKIKENIGRPDLVNKVSNFVRSIKG
ncbi:MAG: tryptophan synthase subunit alpha [Candidatus Omnitrophica bacterium]|nr:tryptophan synthase subunit alpha [Candidatus Omnitrophota bacterium]